MAHVIIVLGNRNKKIMEKRVEYAIKEFNILHQGYDPDVDFLRKKPPQVYLLFSGGSSDGISKPEGAIMMNEFAKTQLTEDQMKYCMIESKSKNTVENLARSRVLIEKEFSEMIHCFGEYPKITICTSTFHIQRSAMIAKFVFSEKWGEIKYIHTAEEIQEEDRKKEEASILNFVRYTYKF